MLKKAVQQGRSKRRGGGVRFRYVEPLSDARTTLADFFSILLPRGTWGVEARLRRKGVTNARGPEARSTERSLNAEILRASLVRNWHEA